MNRFDELAERCEKAEGPDRELDDLIYVATGGCLHKETHTEWSEHQQAFYPVCEQCGQARPRRPIRRYTASLDAAMTLVPEGHMIAHVGQGDNGRWWAEVRRGYITSYSEAFPVLSAATPALALCAAALRARARGEEKKEEDSK